MAVEVRHEMHVVHETQKGKGMTQDERLVIICGEMLSDILTYIDELLYDRLHDRWEEWTSRMDNIAEELNELTGIIGQLEKSSKLRMLDKKFNAYYKEIHPEIQDAEDAP